MSFLQKLFGPPDIGKLRAKRNVRELVRALSYEDDESIQRAAIDALEGMALSEEHKALVRAHKLLHQKAQVATAIDKVHEDNRRQNASLSHWSSASDYDSSQMGVYWAERALEENEAKLNELLAEAKKLDRLLGQARVELENRVSESKDKYYIAQAQKVLGRL